jgi:hypothetical protein
VLLCMHLKPTQLVWASWWSGFSAYRATEWQRVAHLAVLGRKMGTWCFCGGVLV